MFSQLCMKMFEQQLFKLNQKIYKETIESEGKE
jgi:hypothetical protein